MGRYGRSAVLIAVIVIAAGLALGFQRISLGNFQRGGDAPLGLSLGLDLQGGIHLVYQAELTDPESGEPVEVSADQMEALQRAIERRVNSSGLGEPIIQILGADRLLIQLPGVRDRERAVSLIGETARLEFKRRELNVARDVTEISAEDVLSVSVGPMPSPPGAEDAAPEPEAEPTPEPESGEVQPPVPPEVAAALERAIEEEGLAEDAPETPMLIIEFSESGAAGMQAIADRLLASFADYLAAAQRGDLLPPSTLDLVVDGAEYQRFTASGAQINRVAGTNIFAINLPLNADNEPQDMEEAKARVGENPTIVFTEIQGYVDEDTGLTGDDLSRAFPGQHTTSQLPIVNLEFDDNGTRVFGEMTTDIVRKAEESGIRDQIAIILDGEELISPQVNSPITAGTAIIEGRDFTVERVRDLALLLESGRLPVPIRLIQERDVDAILGADSLAKSLVAGVVGLGLVLAFMTLYYRLPGLMASIALVIYATLVLAVFKLTPVTLTLSGVAALILSIGMAVDANILIFERMKDELRAGRTLLTSINIGFDRAWPAIRDGNVSTLITCGILFWFADQLGASIVQGFAATLAIGVCLSMFTAITVSRALLRIAASARFMRVIRLWLPSGGGEIAQPAVE